LVAEWGSVLRGSVCPGAEWLRARGGLYLPMRLRGAPALLQVLGEVPVLYHAYFRLRLPTEFQDLWGRFRDSLVRQGTALHFGVSLSADKAWGHCRAAFATREAMRQHLLDVGATWRAAARGPAALDRLELHGPRPDTEELRRSAALAALGVSPARCVVYQGFYSLWGGGAAEGPPGPLCTLRVVPRSPFRAAGRGPFGWADVAHLWEACHAAGAAAAPGLLDVPLAPLISEVAVAVGPYHQVLTQEASSGGEESARRHENSCGSARVAQTATAGPLTLALPGRRRRRCR
ncbi:unnamed protein product, partial [Prorocentrum cordatum]